MSNDKKQIPTVNANEYRVQFNKKTRENEVVKGERRDVHILGDHKINDCKQYASKVDACRKAYAGGDAAERQKIGGAIFFAECLRDGVTFSNSDGDKFTKSATWNMITGRELNASQATRASVAGQFCIDNPEAQGVGSIGDLYSLASAQKQALAQVPESKTAQVQKLFSKAVKDNVDDGNTGEENRAAIMAEVAKSKLVTIEDKAGKASAKKRKNAKTARAVSNGTADPADVAELIASHIMGDEWRVVSVALGQALANMNAGNAANERFASFAENVAEGINS